MAILDTNHDRAALIILILGAALVVALSPFATGLIGIPVLYVVFAPLHDWLARHARSSAFSLVGTATRLALNLVISLFGLYYLLLRPAATWAAVGPYIPFSPANADQLRIRFRNVTTSTIIGTGLTAVIQGAMVAAGFAVTGLPHALV